MRDSSYFPIEIKGLLSQTAVVPITVLSETKPVSGNCPSGTGRPCGAAKPSLPCRHMLGTQPSSLALHWDGPSHFRAALHGWPLLTTQFSA